VDIYSTEAEQIEVIKEWWKKYGVTTLLTFFLVIIAVFGIKMWQQRHERMLYKASAVYERMINASANNDTDLMQLNAARLIDHYRSSPYAQLAALMLARQAVYKGQLDVAEAKLKWIMKHGRNKALRQLARIRAARVLLAENKPEQGLELLQRIDDETFTASAQEAMGDILLALGKPDDAKKAYNDALNALPGVEVMQPLLQMKLDNLAVPLGPTIIPLATE
jgi:predicted negative regulator of RcsB-dependent stress response